MNDDSFEVISSSGSYGDYAKLRGYMKDGQFAVVRYRSWLSWYNQARFNNNIAKIEELLPKPKSIHNSQKEARQVCDELNSVLKSSVSLN